METQSNLEILRQLEVSPLSQRKPIEWKLSVFPEYHAANRCPLSQRKPIEWKLTCAIAAMHISLFESSLAEGTN